MKADEIDIVAAAMFRNFKEVDDTGEAGRASECGRDIVEADLRNRIDLDVTLFHAIPLTDFDTRVLPYANAAFDVAAAHALA